MKRQPYTYNGETVLGTDVSKWQTNFASILPTVVEKNPRLKFVISRTGDGKSTDATFFDNYTATINVGLVPGSYHYIRCDRDGKTQAIDVVTALDRVKFEPGKHLPPAVDLEDGARTDLPGGVFTGENGTQMPINLVFDETMEMLTELEKRLGVRPLMYTGQAFHWWFSQGRPDLAAEFAKYPLWLPSYTPRPMMPVDSKGKFFPWDKPTIWQTTGTGKLLGYSGNIDLNSFLGSEQELETFVKGTDVLGRIAQAADTISATQDSTADINGIALQIQNIETSLSAIKRLLLKL